MSRLSFNNLFFRDTWTSPRKQTDINYQQSLSLSEMFLCSETSRINTTVVGGPKVAVKPSELLLKCHKYVYIYLF